MTDNETDINVNNWSDMLDELSEELDWIEQTTDADDISVRTHNDYVNVSLRYERNEDGTLDIRDKSEIEESDRYTPSWNQ